MLKIGISSCFMYPDPKRVVFGPKVLAYLEEDMSRYITQEGVLPVLLPNVRNDLLSRILAEMDGFVFQGGTDMAPESYGEKPIVPGKWLGDPYRDEYELKIMDYAVKNKKPVLAICRGLQLMNVYFGGTLYQDIGTQLPQAGLHRDAGLYDTLFHPVELVKGKILDRLYSHVQDKRVNSVHHQAIKDLGKDVEILARCSEDGIIEAIGHTGEEEGRIIGIQWHPEFSVGNPMATLDPLKLYHMFLDHVKNSQS